MKRKKKNLLCESLLCFLNYVTISLHNFTYNNVSNFRLLLSVINHFGLQRTFLISRPSYIQIDFDTCNYCFRGLTNILNERGSLNMYQSGESLMRMSPPSLVSSLLMESSGTFNAESLESRKSMPSHKDSGNDHDIRLHYFITT